MTSARATVPGGHRQRRLSALLLLAWLNLLIQPCVAGLPAKPAMAEHCDHRGSPDHTTSCAAMQAAACEASADLNANAPHSLAPPRTGLPLWTANSSGSGAIAGVSIAADPARATGPPLNILYCNLRN